MCIYIYIYIYVVHICMYVYMHIHIHVCYVNVEMKPAIAICCKLDVEIEIRNVVIKDFVTKTFTLDNNPYYPENRVIYNVIFRDCVITKLCKL